MLVAVSLTLLQGVSGQGFVNLDFEEATIAPTPPGGSVFPADPAQCFPGWTVGGSDAVVMYNDLSFGAPAVELMGPNFPNGVNYAPLQGSYSTALYYFNGSPYLPPTLSQTALIPSDAASINFLVGNGQSDAAISINGSNISLSPCRADDWRAMYRLLQAPWPRSRFPSRATGWEIIFSILMTSNFLPRLSPNQEQ